MIPADHVCLLKVAEAITLIQPTILVDIKGIPAQSKEGLEEWVSIDLLNSMEQPSQTLEHSNKHLLFQLTCFSMHAEYRQDRDFVAPWKLSNKFKPVIHRARYSIDTSCLKFQDVKIIYLDLRSSGDYAKELYQSSPILQTHAVLMTAHAIIS